MSGEMCSVFGLPSSAVSSMAGFGAFGLYMKYFNPNTAAWGLVAGVLSLGNFHLNLMKKMDRLEDYYSHGTLRNLKILGLIVFVGGAIGLASYLGIAIAKHQSFTIIGKNAYTTVITNALTMFAGMSLFCSARKFQHGDYSEINSVIT